MRYFFATRPVVAQSAAGVAFEKLASEAQLDAESPLLASAYDSAFLIALAVEQKGNPDKNGLSSALRRVATAPGEIVLPGEWEKAVALLAQGIKINYQGASGALEFDSNGDVPGSVAEMGIRGGKFVEVRDLQ